MHLFCFGLGYTALHFAAECMDQGFKVSGTCRSLDKQRDLKQRGIRAHLFENITADMLSDVTHLLISIPPFEDTGDMVLSYFQDAIVAMPKLQWVAYLSTTGVYGDHQGAWVDESTEAKPHSVRANRRLEVEQQWLDLYKTHQLPVHVFRLSGIYGPGRNALVGVHDGSARCIDKPGQYFSRIHVEDIAGFLIASLKNPHPGTIYNLADDVPSSALEVQQFAAELLNKPCPPVVRYEQAILSVMQREFYSANRRVSNKKAKSDLAYNLLYPSYKEGLQSLLATL